MRLQQARDGYNFNADAQRLSIELGPKPTSLTRWESEELDLVFQDVHPRRFDTQAEKEGVIGGILNSLTDAMARAFGPDLVFGRDGSARFQIQFLFPKKR